MKQKTTPSEPLSPLEQSLPHLTEWLSARVMFDQNMSDCDANRILTALAMDFKSGRYIKPSYIGKFTSEIPLASLCVDVAISNVENNLLHFVYTITFPDATKYIGSTAHDY